MTRDGGELIGVSAVRPVDGGVATVEKVFSKAPVKHTSDLKKSGIITYSWMP